MPRSTLLFLILWLHPHRPKVFIDIDGRISMLNLVSNPWPKQPRLRGDLHHRRTVAALRSRVARIMWRSSDGRHRRDNGATS